MMSRSSDGSKFIDVEISLDRKYFRTTQEMAEIEYEVEFRSSLPDESTDLRGLGTASFDLKRLTLQLEPLAYGEALGKALFVDAIREPFAAARANADSAQLPIRLRLLIKPEAAELHALHWETLHYPGAEATLLTTDENLPFSRYLLSKNWRSVNRRARHDLKALVVVANPSGLPEILAAIDVEGELQRTRDALAPLQPDVLPRPEENRWATLDNLLEALRLEDYDLLYLVCHGTLAKGEPYLWLENDERKADHLAGRELVSRLRELRQLPRLVVLASCDSAAVEESGALIALGPRLVEEGVPAVVAMQGNIALNTVAEFMPAFFQALGQFGEIDRAMAVARGKVLERPDFWMPVLFMRLKDGSIWYEPGFRGEKGQRVKFEGWPGLVSSIQAGKCTPILGPGLYEWLLGSQREIARRWADTFDYPLAPYERESIVHVAQFLASTQGSDFVLSELRRTLKKEILRFHQSQLPAELLENHPTLDQLIEAAWASRREQASSEPYSMLAKLPFPIYLTANPGTLLEAALKLAKKHTRIASAGAQNDNKVPQVVATPWNDTTESSFTGWVEGAGRNYAPNPDNPLVWHFLGHFGMDDSLVITEDNYFDFMIGINKNLVPNYLTSALTNSSLLFLGFQIDDWNFRAILRYILSLPGVILSKKHIHVAVQINPEESDYLRPEGAYKYLGAYLSSEAKIDTYWGSTEDFIHELQYNYEKWSE